MKKIYTLALHGWAFGTVPATRAKYARGEFVWAIGDDDRVDMLEAESFDIIDCKPIDETTD